MKDESSAVQTSSNELIDQLAVMQEQLDGLRDQLTETQRLATIGTIAAVIAHEFNNLLTPIISYAQFAQQSAESDKPDMELIIKALSKSFASATKAGRICQSMLGLARGQSTLGRVELQSLIDEALLVLARDPKKDGIALRVQVQPGLAVTGDSVQLEQVMLNLLINARQALLGKGGSITIKATPSDDSQEVKIQISDTGAGIAAQHLSRIFEPFFTTKGTARNGEPKGTGLGLAICKEILDHHRGRIEVQSEPGRGTTFTLCLPMAQ